MDLREFFLENFAGDLEYHPRRAALYILLGLGAASAWVFTPHDQKMAAIPVILALGSVTLVGKGVFLLRRSSEGLGLTDQQVAEAGIGKRLPSIPEQAAQVLQDFGAGPLLLWPLLTSVKDMDSSWQPPPRLWIFLSGAVLFAFGWLVRRLTAQRQA